jgi:phenylalanyl-tRNA synthetase beta chain
VDITNYVMLEYGQPMHAFDYRYVGSGKIVVRRAHEGEVLTTLDGNEHTLTNNMLVIADSDKAIGLAGIMGGLNSEILDTTTTVVFESANFDGTCIRKTANALGMRTDASSKYEKNLNPLTTYPAIQRACELVEQLGAGDVMDGVIDVLNYVPQPVSVAFEPEKINRHLGTDISREDMVSYLTRLGFTVEGDTLHVPEWRTDIHYMADVAEEVARIYGYDNIPVTMFRGATAQGGYTDEQKKRNLTGSVCRGMGYSEILTYSFDSPSMFDDIRLPADSPLRNAIRIINPLGEDTSIMRTTAIPSMLEVLARNEHYHNSRARLYELARVYAKREDSAQALETQELILGAYGDKMDFFRLKGAVETVLTAFRVNGVSFTANAQRPVFHPGRCADVLVNGQVIGTLGEIHPLVAKNYDVANRMYVAKLDFTTLLALQNTEIAYQPLPKYPAMTRDIALVCDAAIPVADLERCIAKGGKGLVKEIELFDIYTDAPIPAGKKSVAFSLKLRAEDHTLTDAESDADVKAILALLEQELNAVLR